jgi:transposase
MPGLTPLAPHLTLEELFTRYRQSTNTFDKTHWQILWWRAQGRGTKEVAQLVGYRPDWIRRIVRDYNANGAEAVRDRRAGNGAAPMLDQGQQEELLSLLMGPAPDGGLWTAPKVAQWMSEQLGRPVRQQRGWDYLQRFGLSTQCPRPRHLDADAQEQEEFKKNSTRSSMPNAGLIPRRKFTSGARTKPGWG